MTFAFFDLSLVSLLSFSLYKFGSLVYLVLLVPVLMQLPTMVA
jgi:hypothetical protein